MKTTPLNNSPSFLFLFLLLIQILTPTSPFSLPLPLPLTTPPFQTSSIDIPTDPLSYLDSLPLHITGGLGGKGCVSFRREKCEPMGGPSGGSGGHGGSVYLLCKDNLNSLTAVGGKVHHKGGKGKNGTGKSRDGANGDDLYIPVPPGTIVSDLKTGVIGGELVHNGDTFCLAKGGRGGRGNKSFLSSRLTGPKLSEIGGDGGGGRWIKLELRSIGDVGIVGMPNAGKSSFLRGVTRARPKVAGYPFTTVVPNLGVWDSPFWENGDANVNSNVNAKANVKHKSLVLCDIPGLIEGCSSGRGMGDAFLRHVKRCRALLHVIDCSILNNDTDTHTDTNNDTPRNSPLDNYNIIRKEIALYDPEMTTSKAEIILLNKIDLLLPSSQPKLTNLITSLRTASNHTRIICVSALTKANVNDAMLRISNYVSSLPPTSPLPPPITPFAVHPLDADPLEYNIISDPAYPRQYRLTGRWIEEVAKMTNWEYEESVERFGRMCNKVGINAQLAVSGAEEGDMVMIGGYDFEFNPEGGNPWVPSEVVEGDRRKSRERVRVAVGLSESKNKDNNKNKNEEKDGDGDEDEDERVVYDDEDEEMKALLENDEVWEEMRRKKTKENDGEEDNGHGHGHGRG